MLFRQITEHFNDPPEPVLVTAATVVPPAWLASADDQTWDLVARVALALGEWLAASRSWIRVAGLRSGEAAAGPLATAAVAAREGGDPVGYDKLLAEATRADSRNPRVVMLHLDESSPPADQLASLDALETSDPEELGLLAGQRTILHLLTPDVGSAKNCLEEVHRYLPESAVVAGLEVSVAIQEGRLAVLAHQSLDRGALHAAADTAKQTRERLLKERRFSESTRLVMLRAETHALLGARDRASAVLREALPEERETQEQKEVLALCAGDRALDAGLTLELLESAEATPVVRRLRLDAAESIGTPSERAEALDGLDEMVSEGGHEAIVAAFSRLGASLSSTPTGWSDEAAVFLRSHGHERAAVTVEALYRVGREGWEATEQLLRPYGETPWAVAARLRASLHNSVDRQVGIAMANAALNIGPGHALRLDAARALANGREYGAARQVLIVVARDPNAPHLLRADAYDALIRIVGRNLGQWRVAGEFHDEWSNLVPSDQRAQSWAPMVARRRRDGQR